jgi:peptide deformylase
MRSDFIKGAKMPILRQIAQLGQPVLRNTAKTVTDPSNPTIQALIGDMLATVADVNGVGIAAPQVFESLQIFIIASRPSPRYPHAPALEPTVMINPVITWMSNELDKGWEGCLSIPGIRSLVPRNTRIAVKYLTLKGETQEEELTGFVARIFQHEFDHLNGVVFIDRVENTIDIVTEKEYLRIIT